jgi:hypothetical protein
MFQSFQDRDANRGVTGLDTAPISEAGEIPCHGP